MPCKRRWSLSCNELTILRRYRRRRCWLRGFICDTGEKENSLQQFAVRTKNTRRRFQSETLASDLWKWNSFDVSRHVYSRFFSPFAPRPFEERGSYIKAQLRGDNDSARTYLCENYRQRGNKVTRSSIMETCMVFTETETGAIDTILP